jgi:hypothetical protein
MERSFRNANLGIAACAVVLAVGFIFFHDSEGAMEALGITAFIVAMSVMFLLDRRDERARGGRTPPSS